MELTDKDVDPRSRKRVGNWGKAPVIEMATYGGLHVVIAVKAGVPQIIGAGPHRGVARFLAQKKANKEIVFNDLRKADHVPEAYFRDQLPYYEAYTQALDAALAARLRR